MKGAIPEGRDEAENALANAREWWAQGPGGGTKAVMAIGENSEGNRLVAVVGMCEFGPAHCRQVMTENLSEPIEIERKKERKWK